MPKSRKPLPVIERLPNVSSTPAAVRIVPPESETAAALLFTCRLCETSNVALVATLIEVVEPIAAPLVLASSSVPALTVVAPL